jgi:hypothetical protein
MMKSIRSFFILAVFAGIAGFVINGCSSSSSPSNNSNLSASVKPKMGSMFTDSVSTKDTTFANQPGNSTTYTLVDTNATVAGKSGVYAFVSSTVNLAGKLDTIYQHYESNGDLSLYTNFEAAGYSIGQEWVTFPFASQTTSNTTPLSTVIVGDTVTVTGTVQGAGSETEIVDGKSLFVEKATQKSQAASPQIGTIPATLNVTYAPSIGLITYYDLTEQGRIAALNLNLNGGTTEFVTSYTLK